jgi:release factor glutamine methyltransferase
MRPETTMPQEIPLPRFGRVGTLIGKLQFRVRKWLGHGNYDDYALEHIDGRTILVLPTVFNPRVLRTGEFFAAQLTAETLARVHSVLDMGTGSGVCAIACAEHVRRVLAIDINPAAVRCARVNALINEMESRVEVREGDLFDEVGDERFDLVLFNPPFIRATPHDTRDYAWRGTDVMDRFAEELREHLRPGGCALVLLSTFGDAPTFLESFGPAWSVERWAQREFVNETLAIFKIQPRT